MDENASRAVFVGVSVFIAIITITLIVNFYTTAKESASVANRYDISGSGNARIEDILSKTQIVGTELRYLMNYFYDDKTIEIVIYNDSGVKLTISSDEYWSDDGKQELDEKIRPNYNYEIKIQERGAKTVIVAELIN